MQIDAQIHPLCLHHAAIHRHKHAHRRAKHLGVLRQLHQAALLIFAIYADGAVQVFTIFKAATAVGLPQRGGVDQRRVAVWRGVAHGLAQCLQTRTRQRHHTPRLQIAARCGLPCLRQQLPEQRCIHLFWQIGAHRMALLHGLLHIHHDLSCV